MATQTLAQLAARWGVNEDMPMAADISEQITILQDIASGVFPNDNFPVDLATNVTGLLPSANIVTTLDGKTQNNSTITGTQTRASVVQQHFIAYPGAGSGMTGTGGVDNPLPTFPESITAGTAVFPLTGWKPGDILASFTVRGRIASGGNAVTIDAQLRKTTFATGATTDALVGPAMTQISKTANFLLDGSATTLTSPETLAAGTFYYFLVTVTTGASCSVNVFVETTGTQK